MDSFVIILSSVGGILRPSLRFVFCVLCFGHLRVWCRLHRLYKNIHIDHSIVVDLVIGFIFMRSHLISRT
ncbi:hypothetical protein GGR50DRAFT_671423 [Xylaria sp. CBS 124048]|nr:hypothetical protein GGR50DRAFT_671423 [Xylaria sp. CBS 124048]